jgi:YegS/Rv2252/BmrU family lipid kinase
MRVLVILNPWADQGRGAAFEKPILQAAESFGGVDLVCSEYPGQAVELARRGANDGYDVVVAAGGDGTVNDVVNGLVHGNQAQTRLGVIPIGSGNDMAWSLGIAANDVAAALQKIFLGTPSQMDLARIDDDKGRFRYVDNNIGIGFDAIVVIETHSINRFRGLLMYLMATLRTIAFYYQTPRLRMRFDEEWVEQDSLFVSFGVGPRGGGGFLLTPDARQDDDLLDSMTVNPVNRLTMLYMLIKVLRGTHTGSRHVTMRKSKRIIVHSNMPMPIHTDGEVFAYPQDNIHQVSIVSLPTAISVMV